MISVKEVTKYFGGFLALDKVSFEVGKGDVVAFLGPNGAGKTTTMRIITGFMPPSFGDVLIDGQDVFDEPMDVKRKIGYLPENPPLYPELTVTEYLTFVARLKKVPREKIKAQVDKVIGLTDLGERRETLIAFLSKGLRQRVGIAQSIVNDPKVLILDEPTIGLDPRQVIDIRNLVKHLSGEEKLTIILSTHMLAEASEVCEKAIIINNGRIIRADAIANLRSVHIDQLVVTLSIRRNHDRVTERLSKLEGVRSVSQKEGVLAVYCERDIREEVARAAVEEGAGLLTLGLQEATLEDAFIKLVQ